MIVGQRIWYGSSVEVEGTLLVHNSIDNKVVCSKGGNKVSSDDGEGGGEGVGED